MDLPDITPEIRSDLMFYERPIGDEKGWVVKDPVQRNYFWFDQFQSWLLRRFDGMRTLVELKREFETEFSPAVIDEKDLVGFLVQSSSDQLLVETVSGGKLKSRAANPRVGLFTRLQNVFAIRLPAINARKPIDLAESTFGFLFSQTAFIAFAIAFCIAIVVLFQNATLAWSDLKMAIETPRFAIGFLFAISITKICHEFGHAVACRRMGASCSEGGVMFLFFAPCLYCDVSDARIVEKKSRRAIVMLGGVYFELILATLAILIWVNCDVGPLRNLLLNIAIVASISTILVNLNPLMKFDGYYVFSELVGIHNLSGKSQSAIRNFFRSLLFEIPKSKAPKSGLILGYGFASKIYRVLVYVGFFWFAYSVAVRFGVSAIVVAFGVIGCVAFLFGMVNQSYKTIAHDKDLYAWRPVRSSILALLILLGLIVFFFIKIPSYIYCDAEIRSEGQSIAAPESGILKWGNEPGCLIDEGDTIAILQDDEVLLAGLKAATQVTQIESSLAILNLKASFEPRAAAEIPELTAKLSAAKKRKLEIDQRIADFEIKAPFAGRIIRTTEFVGAPAFDETAYEKESLLGPERLGKSVSVGDGICFLSRENEPQSITVFVNEKKLDLVQVGQRVWIRPSGSVATVLKCRVTGRQSQATRADQISEKRTGNSLGVGDEKQFSISVEVESPNGDSNAAATSIPNGAGTIAPQRFLHGTPARGRILVSRKTPFQMLIRTLAETFQVNAIR